MHKLVDGVRIELTPEEVEARKAEEQANTERQARTAYMHNRKREYGSYADQLDLIFHDGLEAWKDHIQSVKEAYPKPEDVE